MFVCPECGAADAQPGACPNDGQARVDRAEDMLLGTTIGAYRVARLMGVGGMGRVYKGVHPQIGSRVAIKVLSRECADRRDLVDRFFAEARAVNLIRHESIVNVLDLATLPDGRPFIIMEYLDGGPLAAIIAQQGALPLGGLAKLAAEVLDALGAAHAKGIVHRDLKPDNIYVTPAGRPKVLDFGIAKLLPELGGQYTQTGSLLGTPHYMAPEQALGKAVDHRTDVYAMGVILFECVTGQRPFHADSLFDLLRKHVDQPPPPPRMLRADLPVAMEQVILCAMAKHPDQRFANAHAMGQALMQATQGLPTAQWAVVSPTLPGSGGAGSPSWRSGVGWMPSPHPPTPPPPGPPATAPTAYQGLPGTPGAGYAPSPYPPPPPPYHGTPSTATAGQVVAAKKPGGSKKAVWIALAGVVVVGGGVAAAVVLSSSDSKPAQHAGDQPASGVEPAGSDTPEAPDTPDTPDTPEADDWGAPQPDEAKGTTTGKGKDPDKGQDKDDDDDTDTDLAKLAGGGGSTDDMFKQSLDAMDQMLAQIDQIPPQGRAQMLASLRMSREQLEKSVKAMPAQYRKNYQAMVDKLKQAEKKLEGLMGGGSKLIAGGGTTPTQPTPKASAGNGPIQTTPIPFPSGWNPAKFDLSAYTKIAVEHAHKLVDPDARLFRIDAAGVRPDGMADLTLDNNFDVDYRFISPARSKRPDNVPLGMKVEYHCMFRILVHKDGIELREMSGWECNEPKVPLPKCSAREVWKTAIGQGAPDKNAVGELGYRAPSSGKPMWYFDIPGVWSKAWPDGC